MPATLNRESGLDPQQLEQAIELFRASGNMAQAARLLNIPWQRLLFILRDRGVCRPNGQQVRWERAQAERRETTPANRPLTFGIEIECTLPIGTVNIGCYHDGTQVRELPEGWKAKRDGSIQPGEGYEGAEIVSPILTGEDGVRQIITACQWLRRVGARVNPSCGFHVHVGWRGTRQQLARLIRIVAKHERGIFAATGTKRREEGGFTRPISNSRDYGHYATNAPARFSFSTFNRYHVLNLTNLRRGGKHTVEFRAFAGTTNPTKMLAYVSMCIGTVQKALDNTADVPAWDFNAPVHPASGSVALDNLLGELGWGNCTNYGIIAEPTAPGMVAMAFELGRLAQKYDGNLSENDQ